MYAGGSKLPVLTFSNVNICSSRLGRCGAIPSRMPSNFFRAFIFFAPMSCSFGGIGSCKLTSEFLSSAYRNAFNVCLVKNFDNFSLPSHLRQTFVLLQVEAC